eukprot:CAMPEP_0201883300 /NCGR_PEP_ID=MMETSP0902-20130614/15341_1 /ASSEMBLY_ACC=CAM_ASM_000551 /TAXON_ID=420261 /ORGANISM="Thalassiosira antarctica, Strain CCMP982" /LENGTH=195 /DNA_ID=CAMNT_0048412055 /DNA_START=65 /DNA_END=649 /DNA_ORIENTATION=+
MTCLCIGGVCIPYSALLPVLLIGLQWIASQFAKVGLLPESISKRLGLNSAGKKQQVDNSCDVGCCLGKSTSRSESVSTTTTTTTSDDDEGNEEGVEHIDNLERWEEVFTACKNSTLIVKFTAEWCKPCKAIQPAYVSLASKNKGKFTTLDIDGDECDVLSSKLKVAIMPTFVCFNGGTEVGRMSGGNNEEKLSNW